MTSPYSAPYLMAHMWLCNDECGCVQPEVLLVLTDPPTTRHVPLWRGTHRVEPDTAESLEQLQELVQACDRFHISWLLGVTDLAFRELKRADVLPLVRQAGLEHNPGTRVRLQLAGYLPVPLAYPQGP